MTTEPSNQREFTRVPVNCTVSVLADGRPVPCSAVRILSMKGMLVATNEQLPVGKECEITITLVEHEIEIQLMGTVVNNNPNGIAFQFTKIMGPESYEHLRNLVLYNASDTDQVEREFESHSGLRKKDPELS
jgi:Tfp pilus assembly protein PilZ